MILCPAIDLSEGDCVQLVGGKMENEQFRSDDPVAIATKWVEQGARMLHVVDLDAAMGTGTNLWVIDRILRKSGVAVQVGGGVRSMLQVQKLLDMGVARVIIGTQAVKHPEWLAETAQVFPGKVIVAVDARAGEIVVKGWTEGSGTNLYDFARRVQELPLAGLLFTNVEVEGTMRGADAESVRRLAGITDIPIIASGGIGGLDDLASLRDAGADAAVLGMSIYTGRIDLAAALRALAETPDELRARAARNGRLSSHGPRGALSP